jgi:hypothetical protein
MSPESRIAITNESGQVFLEKFIDTPIKLQDQATSGDQDSTFVSMWEMPQKGILTTSFGPVGSL